MVDLLHFRKPAQTTPEADAARQVSRSETPSGLNEAIKHITRAQQPDHFWHHVCPDGRVFNIKLIDGQICPFCGIDKDGIYHGRPDGEA